MSGNVVLCCRRNVNGSAPINFNSHISRLVGNDRLHNSIGEESRDEHERRQDKLDEALLCCIGHIETATSAVVVIYIAHRFRRPFTGRHFCPESYATHRVTLTTDKNLQWRKVPSALTC